MCWGGESSWPQTCPTATLVWSQKLGMSEPQVGLKWSWAKLGRPTPAFELDMGYGRHPVASGCIAAQLCQGVSSQGLAETELAPGDSREEEETA